MKKKKFVVGVIITVIVIALMSALYLNFISKLDNILKSTDITCNESEEQCDKDLKSYVIYSAEARSVFIYTGVLMLFTLNAGAYSLYYFCINKKVLKKSKK